MTFEPMEPPVQAPELVEPVLISAFTTRDKAGAGGTSTLAYLIGQWNAQPIGEIECDDLFNYARIRPQMRRDAGRTVIDWPATQIFHATPPGSDRSFLLMIGLEPHLGWKTFVERVSEFALNAGVKTAVSLRALPAATTHRMPIAVRAIYSSEQMEDRLGLPPAEAEGPLDVGLLLSLRLQSEGCETADITAFEPYYVPAAPQAATTLALVEAIDEAFALSTDKQGLQQAQRRESRALDAAVAQSQELQAVVAQLQEANTRGLLTMPDESWREQGPTDDGRPLDAGELISDVEALLGLGHGSEGPATSE